MPRILAGSLLVLLVAFAARTGLAAPARGLELTWADGSRGATVTEARACTLLVRPARGRMRLPARWRLVYTGLSACAPESALVFLAGPAPAGAARALDVRGPQGDAERLAHETTVEFAGQGDGEPTAAAAFLVRVDPSLHARIAAVDVSPADRLASDRIEPAAEVTVNGGCDLPYPPVIWSAHVESRAGGVHELVVKGIELDGVDVVGLARAGAMPVLALEKTPSGRLGAMAMPDLVQSARPASRDAHVLVVPLAAAPEAGQTLLLTLGVNGPVAATSLVPDQVESAPGILFTPMYPGPQYYAKDFAFIYAGDAFHLFYIRNRFGAPADSTENDLGHAMWTPSQGWTQLDPVLPARPGEWDDLHVWAPSIVYDEPSGTYYMFYTGVTNVPYAYNSYQRIGVATSKDLMTWTRRDAPVFDGNHAVDVFADSSQYNGCQFRDAFVMPDPSGIGWLMYYAASPAGPEWELITHVARSDGPDAPWSSVMPLWNTDFFLAGAQAHYVGFTESPHVFSHNGLWYLFYSSNSTHRINFEYAATPLADSSSWSSQIRLFNVLGGDTLSDHWYASEHLALDHHEYFAYVNDLIDGIEIKEMTWTSPATFRLSAASVLGVTPAATTAAAPGLLLLNSARPGSALGVTVTLPGAMPARVAVYDIQGRRLRTLADRTLPAGATTLAWDRRDARGADAGPGVYFVRLTTPHGDRTARAVVLH